MTFTPSIIPPSLRDRAPELAQRLAAILLGLAGVMARRFLKDPRLVGLIGPLWRRLTRIARRFEGAATRPARKRTARPAQRAAATQVANCLPGRRGWLVHELGWEAAGYASQLAHLLAEPEMQALIAAAPRVERVLRPLCRMLGYDLAAVPQMVAPPLVLAAPVPPPEWRADDEVLGLGRALEPLDFATQG